ncbi:MAG: laccase domain-containing protein [bacterium]|nr:laccase domain-containing protein [bacterium]
MSRDPGSARFHSRPFPQWRYDSSSLSVCFAGRIPGGKKSTRAAILRRLDGAPSDLAWLNQRHSATVRPAAIGDCGEGDGLWTQRRGLALSIVTADCIPIVCGSENGMAAIHAGWRGLAGGVIEATLSELPCPASTLEAWLGPAIGPCCYEVGTDVAARVIAATDSSIASTGSAGRPTIDLHRAADLQLRRLGVNRVHRAKACTKCNPDLLWSYRGTSRTNGRNQTFAWLATAPVTAGGGAGSSGSDQCRGRAESKDPGRRS